MSSRLLQILAASSMAVGMVACDGNEDAVITEPDAAETTDGARTTQPSSSSDDSDTTTPTGTRAFEVVAASTSWSPVLEGVTASPPPTAAACDTANSLIDGELELPDFMPFGPGPPNTGWLAAFDPTTHSVTVIGQHGERVAAGSLDVCTDTWSPISSVLQHPDTGARGYVNALVYDVDSDAMVAYTREGVFVHDAELDEWQHHPVPRDDSGLPETSALSAAYHPASGMVIVADVDQLVAHDIDTDEWMPITSLPFATGYPDFLGVNVAMDRFVFGVAGTSRDDGTTWLAEPVSGQTMVVQTPEHPPVNIGWPNEAFGPADGTIFVTHQATGEVCGFDAETLAWSRCVSISTERPEATSTIVGDPVNDRLIGISTAAIETWRFPRP